MRTLLAPSPGTIREPSAGTVSILADVTESTGDLLPCVAADVRKLRLAAIARARTPGGVRRHAGIRTHLGQEGTIRSVSVPPADPSGTMIETLRDLAAGRFDAEISVAPVAESGMTA